MTEKPTYEELEKRVKKLEKEVIEQEKTEKSILNKDKWLLGLIEAIPDSVYIKDRKGRYLFVNKAFEKVVTKSKEDIIGKSDPQLLPPQLSEKAVGSDKEIIEKLKSIRNEQHFTDIKGETLFFDTIKFPIFDKHKNVKEIGGVSRDITGYKKTEKALKESENRLRMITDNIPAYVSYVDSNLCYHFVNKAYAKFFNKHQDEIIGKHAREVLGKQYYEKIREKIHTVLSGQEVFFEAPYSYKGKIVFLSVAYIPDTDEKGITKGYFILANIGK
jgi:PAS domain S-box-containing protein